MHMKKELIRLFLGSRVWFIQLLIYPREVTFSEAKASQSLFFPASQSLPRGGGAGGHGTSVAIQPLDQRKSKAKKFYGALGAGLWHPPEHMKKESIRLFLGSEFRVPCI